MESNTTFRSFNGSLYVRVLPVYVDYYKLKEQLERAKQNGTDPDCKIEDIAKNKLLVTFPMW